MLFPEIWYEYLFCSVMFRLPAVDDCDAFDTARSSEEITHRTLALVPRYQQG